MSDEHESGDPQIERCVYCRSEEFTVKGRRHWCQDCGNLNLGGNIKIAVLIEAFVNPFVDIRRRLSRDA